MPNIKIPHLELWPADSYRPASDIAWTPCPPGVYNAVANSSAGSRNKNRVSLNYFQNTCYLFRRGPDGEAQWRFFRELATEVEAPLPADGAHVAQVVAQLKQILACSYLKLPEGMMGAMDAVMQTLKLEPEVQPATQSRTAGPADDQLALAIVRGMFFFRPSAHADLQPTHVKVTKFLVHKAIELYVGGRRNKTENLSTALLKMGLADKPPVRPRARQVLGDKTETDQNKMLLVRGVQPARSAGAVAEAECVEHTKITPTDQETAVTIAAQSQRACQPPMGILSAQAPRLVLHTAIANAATNYVFGDIRTIRGLQIDDTWDAIRGSISRTWVDIPALDIQNFTFAILVRSKGPRMAHGFLPGYQVGAARQLSCQDDWELFSEIYLEPLLDEVRDKINVAVSLRMAAS